VGQHWVRDETDAVELMIPCALRDAAGGVGGPCTALHCGSDCTNLHRSYLGGV
jgi:hypothetical protein